MATEAQIKNLEKKIEKLDSAIKSFQKTSKLDELLIIIHRQGWTTPREIFFVTGIINAIQSHVETISGLHQTLLSGSDMIGKK
jgi:hypothetical protein